MRPHWAAAFTKELHDHEAGDRAGARRPAEADARPGDHRGRRAALKPPRQDAGAGVYSVLYAEAKRADGLVVQTGRGEFKLNPKRRKAAA